MKKILLIALIILNIATVGYCLRASRPFTLTMPLTQDQLTQLNNYLNDIWNMQGGRFELDVVTTPKNAAKAGEIWIYNNSGVYSLQVRVGGVVRSVTLSP